MTTWRHAAIVGAFLLVLAPVNARAMTISPGQLMYTDFFLWPNWREILAEYDCRPELLFYLWNAPPPVVVVVIPPPPIEVAPPPIDTPLPPIVVIPPVIIPPIIIPPITGDVPELSTFIMLVCGFAGLGFLKLKAT